MPLYIVLVYYTAKIKKVFKFKIIKIILMERHIFIFTCLKKASKVTKDEIMDRNVFNKHETSNSFRRSIYLGLFNS